MRGNLLSQGGEWIRPKLFTLTVDPKRFDSPQAAWRYVTNGKYLPRLLRGLGIKRWVWVLEFQSLERGGWPHWHVLIDVGRLPRAYVDLDRAWRLWRDEWHIGGVDLNSRKREACKGVVAAIRYITKYLIKSPKGGFPDWVLALSRVRFIQGSQAVGALVSRRRASSSSASRPGDENGEDRKRKREKGEPSPLAQRVKGCGKSSVVLDQDTGFDGEPRRRFVGNLAGSPGRVVLLSKLGKLPQWTIVPDHSGGEMIGFHVVLGDGEDARDVLSRLQANVEDAAVREILIGRNRRGENCKAWSYQQP